MTNPVGMAKTFRNHRDSGFFPSGQFRIGHRHIKIQRCFHRYWFAVYVHIHKYLYIYIYMYAYIVWDDISNDGHLCSALCHKGALWIYFYILKPIWRLSQLLRSLNFRHLLERYKSKHRKPTVVFKLPDQKLGCQPAFLNSKTELPTGKHSC